MWGKGQRGNSVACSTLSQLSITSPTTHKQIGPFWCWFLGGWVCVCSRIPWVSPINCPVRLGVSPTATTPTGFFSQRFWGFISLCWNPGLCRLSHFPVVPPSLFAHKCGTNWSQPLPPPLVLQPLPCHKSSLPQLPIPPTGLDECFFFNSLFVGLPYS